MRNILLAVSVIALSVAGLCPCALAQDAAAPKPKPPVMVIVVKTDGTSLRGSIVSSDPEQVVLRPARKPGEKTDAEPVAVPWKQIKTVSNGLTQAKALETWKAEHREQLCETCRGNRRELCKSCKGTARDPASAADCKTCKGELLVDCKTPKCNEGKVPCPAPCIKRYEGQWVQHEGKTVRYFNTPKGRHWFSEAHVGELLVLDRKAGELKNEGKCKTCDGTTYVECQTCGGVGKTPCATCLARSDAPPCTASCDDGRTACATCSGTGMKPAN